MPRCAEPWWHMVVVCMCVYVCVCVCVSFAYVSPQRLKTKHQKLQCRCNTLTLFCNFRIIYALLCSYGVTCSPWHLLRALQRQAKTKLPIADCFSIRQLRQCHRPCSNMSATRKQDRQNQMLATICPTRCLKTACNWRNSQICVDMGKSTWL